MAQTRKDKLVNGQIYHIFTRSIAKFVVFNDQIEFERMRQLLDLYRYQNFNYKFSQFLDLTLPTQSNIIENLRSDNRTLVDIIAFCLMPTHIHFALKQNTDDGISKYMARILNGYSRFFNTKHQRLGPLWSARFKSILVNQDNQLLHLTRYIHLNPSSAGVVDKPEQWEYSSYSEYLNDTQTGTDISNRTDLFDITPKQYRIFVEDRKDYQKQLSLIKSITIDDYSG